MLDSAEATPIYSLFITLRPSFSLIRTAALGAYQQFGKRVFSAVFTERGKRFVGGFAFAAAPHQFCLYRVKQVAVNDCGVIIAYKIFCALAAVDFCVFADAVGTVGLLVNHIADIFFVGQYFPNVLFTPNRFSGRGFYTFAFKICLYLIEAVSLIIHLENVSYDLGLLRNNTRLCFIFILAIPKHIKAAGIGSVLHTLSYSPRDVGTYIFTFGLCHNTVNADIGFAVLLEGVNILFLKIYADSHCFQLSDIADAVHNITGKTGNRFCENHIDFAFFAVPYHFKKTVSLFDHSTCDSLIRIYTYKTPFRILIDMLRII